MSGRPGSAGVDVTITLIGDGEGSVVVAMKSDVKGQEDRHPVYLPENRHHWASNDEVDKPRAILRGPVRPIFPKNSAKPGFGSYFDSGTDRWLQKNLPRIGASLIVGIVIVSVVLATYAELVVLLSR